MSNNNIVKFMKNSSMHVANINRNLRNIKSEVAVDFIQAEPVGITIITNKVSQASDLTTIENYIKKGISYFPNGNLQERLNSSDVENIIKQNHIFNNVTLVSKPRVIKVSPKSDMAIV